MDLRIVANNYNLSPSPSPSPQHHGSSVQGLKEYKRSRERQQSSVTTNILLPQQMSDVDLDGTAVQVSCGSFHALLLTSEGSVYSWGSNNHGQLGQAHTAEKVGVN